MKNEGGKTVSQIWEELFVENESRKERWTDEQLAEEFKARFPGSKGRPRPSMHRSAYNAGSYAWEKLGAPETRGLPRSKQYDEKGREILPGRRKAVVDNETGDPDLIPLSRFMKKSPAGKKARFKTKKPAKKALSHRKPK